MTERLFACIVCLLPNRSDMSPLKILSDFCLFYLFKSFNFLEQGILNLYPFSVHVVTFNFITNLLHLFN